LVLAFLFSGNANAGVNEPGTGLLGRCEGGLKWEHKKLKKIYLESDKKINVVLYGACTSDRYAFGHHKGKNLEKVIKKTYKICMKYMCKSCKTVCNDITEHITKVHKFSEFIMKLQLKTNPNTYKNCFVKIK